MTDVRKRNISGRVFAFSLLMSMYGLSALAEPLRDETKPAFENAGTPDDHGFLDAHPDLRWRTEAMRAYDKQRYEAAMMYFRRAARYADKVSQAMVAEMLWNGTGASADRALAYVWMDLAAERGYAAFVLAREQYWAELSEADQQRASTLGPAVFDELEDRAAKPRLERVLERARRSVTGSRVGVVGSLVVQVRGPSGMIEIPAHQYYDTKFWKADEYWEWQDEVWQAPPKGEVRVGPIINAVEAPSP